MVRAKFKVTAITHYIDYAKVELNPVTSGSEENKQYFSYTPSGKIEMNIKSAAIEQFEVGKEYYVDFTPAIESATTAG